MSEPQVIISAVHELTESPESFWTDDSVQNVVEDLEKDVFQDEVLWNQTTAKFRSTVALEKFSVKTPYHSNRKSDVIEIVLAGEDSMKDIQITQLEKIFEEINAQFDYQFTLEAYYWYNGVDKTGGTTKRSM